MFLSPIIAEAHILVTPLLQSHTKHFCCYLDSNTTLLETKSHLNYNTINHYNLIRMDISPKLNGANIKQLKEQDNNNNISTLTLRRLMSYIYGAPILDVSRSHTTTQHSR